MTTTGSIQPLRAELEQPRVTLECAAPMLTLDEPARLTLNEFYRQHNYSPVWQTSGRMNGLLEQLEQMADDGLDPASYQLASLKRLSSQSAGPAQASCTDLLASHAYLQALRHLAWGRLDPTALEPLWHSPQEEPASPALLPTPDAVRGVDDLAATFDRARPQTAAYRDLRRAWVDMRRQTGQTLQRIPAGPLLRPGASDARVPLLEKRLAAAGYLNGAHASKGNRYGPQLADAVKHFQRDHQMQPDGVVGPSTVAALNGNNANTSSRRDQVRVNLERLRWLAREQEPTMVLVDVAGAEISYLRDGNTVWKARTQVGRPERATPLLKSRISHLTLNPTWTVPPTIMREDKLPQIRRDRGFLARNGLRVVDRNGKVLSPGQVNWSNPSGIVLRQDAGPRNPLGRVAIRFSNPFSVYLHDTPSKHLFDRLPRVFSSGCVRVEEVRRLVEHLMEDASPTERARLDKQLASGRTQDFHLPRSIPVLLAYWTAEATPDGRVIFKPDLYQHDARILAALDRARR